MHSHHQQHILIDIAGVLADPGVDPASLYHGTVTAMDGALEAVSEMQSLAGTTLSVVCTSPDHQSALTEWARHYLLPLYPAIELLEATRVEALGSGVLITANQRCEVPESPFEILLFGSNALPRWSEWYDFVVAALGRQCQCSYDSSLSLCASGLCATEEHIAFCEHERCRQCSGQCNCTYNPESERCYGERCHYQYVPHIKACEYKRCIDCDSRNACSECK